MEEKEPLQQLRQNIGLTQEELSRYLSIPKRTIENYESGKRTPPSWVYDLILDKLSLFEKERQELFDEKHGIYSLSQLRLKTYPIFEKYRVKKAILFGSYAKGKANEESDIDLVVEAPLEGLAFYDLANALEDALHKKVDLFRVDQIQKGGKTEQEIAQSGLRLFPRVKASSK
jgi:predicted nucleotidyltransferase